MQFYKLDEIMMTKEKYNSLVFNIISQIETVCELMNWEYKFTNNINMYIECVKKNKIRLNVLILPFDNYFSWGNNVYFNIIIINKFGMLRLLIRENIDVKLAVLRLISNFNNCNICYRETFCGLICLYCINYYCYDCLNVLCNNNNGNCLYCKNKLYCN